MPNGDPMEMEGVRVINIFNLPILIDQMLINSLTDNLSLFSELERKGVRTELFSTTPYVRKII